KTSSLALGKRTEREGAAGAHSEPEDGSADGRRYPNMTSPDSPPSLTLTLFGLFAAQFADGTSLPRLRNRKRLRLLALLARRVGGEVERSWHAGTLWPESPESDALHSLRQLLSQMRQALGPEAGRLSSPTTRTVRLELAGAAVDVLDFDAAVS